MWHAIAPVLAETYQVICPDLRGYGRSLKPVTDATHTPYSKRAMGSDVLALMNHLGHERFLIGSHDRGSRVAHRLAADHPERVIALAILDIAPTREMYRDASSSFAHTYWHWYWLTQPHPFPEHLIGADPAFSCSRRAPQAPLVLPLSYSRRWMSTSPVSQSPRQYTALVRITGRRRRLISRMMMPTPVSSRCHLWRFGGRMARLRPISIVWRSGKSGQKTCRDGPYPAVIIWQNNTPTKCLRHGCRSLPKHLPRSAAQGNHRPAN
ncbi:alpha/beta fold hydrolase [Yoonia algicola]|uniref:alpha/beta fold hydrolase n=1 Tax=Yoonia algicola TaxID=3137368 RepID=UPI003CC79CCD